jgi:hypothetical protein
MDGLSQYNDCCTLSSAFNMCCMLFVLQIHRAWNQVTQREIAVKHQKERYATNGEYSLHGATVVVFP